MILIKRQVSRQQIPILKREPSAARRANQITAVSEVNYENRISL